jgi:hypothetical protein
MPQTNVNDLLTLEKQIAAGRRKLQELYDACGGTTPEVLALSIELDELMNEYEKKQFRVSGSMSHNSTFR